MQKDEDMGRVSQSWFSSRDSEDCATVYRDLRGNELKTLLSQKPMTVLRCEGDQRHTEDTKCQDYVAPILV